MQRLRMIAKHSFTLMGKECDMKTKVCHEKVKGKNITSRGIWSDFPSWDVIQLL